MFNETFYVLFVFQRHDEDLMCFFALSSERFSNVSFLARVPDPLDVAFGELKQGDLCLDTMGHFTGGSVRANKCHGNAGNQVGESVFEDIVLQITG